MAETTAWSVPAVLAPPTAAACWRAGQCYVVESGVGGQSVQWTLYL